MMKKNLSLDNAVAPVHHRPDTHSLAKVLVLCQGLQGISSTTQIFNKRFWLKPPFNPKDFFERGKSWITRRLN
jgi:hypothetical protein